MTGKTPRVCTAAQVMMRDRIPTGVPSEVENQMSDNPLIPGALWDQWTNWSHEFGLEKYQKKNKHQKDQAAAVANSLKQIQLEQAEKVQKKVDAKQCPVTTPPQPTNINRLL